MEAIQLMTLKFDIGDLLTIRNLHTQFRLNLKGVVIFIWPGITPIRLVFMFGGTPANQCSTLCYAFTLTGVPSRLREHITSWCCRCYGGGVSHCVPDVC